MDTTNLLADGAAILLIAFLLIYQLWPRKVTSGPPEPAGRRPLMGHLHLFSGSSTPTYRTLAAFSDQYGPMFVLQLGRRRTLVLSSAELAKECFTGNDRAFADRPALINAKYIGYNYAMIGFAPYGAYWREIRKICIQELLSGRRLEMLKHIRNEETNSLLKCLYRECRKEGEVELQKRLRFLAMNIVLRMVARKRYFVEDSNKEDGEGKEFLQALGETTHLFGIFTVSDAIPWLEWLDVGSHVRAMKRANDKLDKIVTGWVAEHRRRRDSGEAINNPDFIDVLISQLQDGHLSDFHPPDNIIKATALTMVSGGTTTTSDTLEWALSLLLNNPHELKKAQDELDFHVGTERQVEESDISKLSYLQAIVKETLRLYPPAPLLVPHHSTEPVNIAGYNIPAGTDLYVNVWKVHRDPRVWADPEEFKPGRFVTTHKEVKVDGQSFELLPFGSGRRSCPGLLMALQFIHLVLARLLHGFEWRAPGNGPVDMSEEIGLFIPKAVPLHALLRPRLPSHLYQ
ncbi:cytochrome P450 CYP82D47-like isoform X1 [Nymphaea colorata]|nr:cytochrome P450 CYP82D47-like isoform X1 [Nymphaea colorata]XP_031484582.1 cytochrome P450 CYP82D47-like isoform X1 [Nymphaea colorata]